MTFRPTTRTAVCLAIILVAGSASTTGQSKTLLLTAYLALVIALVIHSDLWSPLIVATLIPLNGLVRWGDLDNPLAAGLFTLVLLLIGLITFFKYAVSRSSQLRLVNSGQTRIVVALVAVLLTILFVHSVRLMSSPVVFLLVTREYLVVFLVIPIVYRAYNQKSHLALAFFETLFWVSAIVGLLNLIHLFWGIPSLHESRWVTLRGVDYGAQTRTIAGTTLPRMQHLLGLSTQGAGATFYVIQGFIGAFMVRRSGWSRRTRSLALLSCSILFLAAALTVSMSLMVTTIVLLLYSVIQVINRKKTIQSYALFLLIILFTVFIAMSSSFTTGTQQVELVSYGIESFIAPAFELLEQYSFGEVLFGSGLVLRSGGRLGANLTSNSGVAVDRWVFTILLQTGLLGFTVVLFLWIATIKQAIQGVSSRSNHETCRLRWMSGAVAVGLIGFSHGAAPVERLFSPMFFAVVALGLVTTHRTEISLAGRVV